MAGSTDYEESARFIEGKFSRRFHRKAANPSKPNETGDFYPHRTCGTDTKQIEFVIESTIEMIAMLNLQGSGLS